MNDKSPAQNKLIKYIKSKDPKASDIEVTKILNDLEKFVKVIQKIYIEPQVNFKVQKLKINGKTLKRKSIVLNMEELKKVRDRSKVQEPLVDVLRRLYKIVTKDKYGRT